MLNKIQKFINSDIKRLEIGNRKHIYKSETLGPITVSPLERLPKDLKYIMLLLYNFEVQEFGGLKEYSASLYIVINGQRLFVT